VRDIAQGAEALSEIDFSRLCVRFGLPRPVHQAIRVEPGGALHLTPRRWWDDQFRQNELTIGGTSVLRFPSVVLRTEPALVADQLRRVIGL
jgi:hypothetical protein